MWIEGTLRWFLILAANIRRGQTQCPQNELVEELSGVISSPNWPSNYPDGLSCGWRIGGEGYIVRVRFTAFNVENDNACRFDYMEIDGTRYCGTEIPDVDGFIAPLTVNFVSDGSVNREGFQLFYFLEERSGSGDLIPDADPFLFVDFDESEEFTTISAVTTEEITTEAIIELTSSSSFEQNCSIGNFTFDPGTILLVSCPNFPSFQSRHICTSFHFFDKPPPDCEKTKKILRATVYSLASLTALFGLATVYSFNSIYTQTLLYALNIHEIRTTRIRRLGSQSTMNPLKHLPRHKFKSRFNR